MNTLILLVLVWTVAAVVFSAVTLVRVLRQPAAPAPGRVPPLLLLRPWTSRPRPSCRTSPSRSRTICRCAR